MVERGSEKEEKSLHVDTYARVGREIILIMFRASVSLSSYGLRSFVEARDKHACAPTRAHNNGERESTDWPVFKYQENAQRTH